MPDPALNFVHIDEAGARAELRPAEAGLFLFVILSAEQVDYSICPNCTPIFKAIFAKYFVRPFTKSFFHYVVPLFLFLYLLYHIVPGLSSLF